MIKNHLKRSELFFRTMIHIIVFSHVSIHLHLFQSLPIAVIGFLSDVWLYLLLNSHLPNEYKLKKILVHDTFEILFKHWF